MTDEGATRKRVTETHMCILLRWLKKYRPGLKATELAKQRRRDTARVIRTAWAVSGLTPYRASTCGIMARWFERLFEGEMPDEFADILAGIVGYRIVPTLQPIPRAGAQPDWRYIVFSTGIREQRRKRKFAKDHNRSDEPRLVETEKKPSKRLEALASCVEKLWPG